MAQLSNTEFGATTNGTRVAEVFSDKIQGKTILITGVNTSGIGYSSAHALASQNPTRIIIAGRTREKLEKSLDTLRSEFPAVDYRILIIDLSRQESVRQAADEILSWDDVPAIDLVINSAGIACVPERTLTEQGIELHFATNHIGHFLLSCLIMPKLIKAAQDKPKGTVRIVNVTSGSPMAAQMRWSDMTFQTKHKDLPEEEKLPPQFLPAWGYKDGDEMTYIPIDGYNRSKVANVLFGIAANKRLFEKHGIFCTAVHPGVIETELVRDFSEETMASINEMREKGVYTYKTLDQGSATSLVAALDPGLAQGVGDARDGTENWGSFLVDCQISDKARPGSVSSSEAERLWEMSEKMVGQTFSW